MTTKGQQLFVFTPSKSHHHEQPPPSTSHHHRHPELVSGSVLTQQTTDTEINSA
jgi:hypothetical protein